MYTPPAFRIDDHAAMQDFITQVAPFAILVSNGENGPVATHLPLFLDKGEGTLGTLYGHLAKANPHWKNAGPGQSLAIFSGLDAYISPNWYATKQQNHKVVPTWNYDAVHAYGHLEIFDEPDALRQAVETLTNLHESGQDVPWRVGDAPAAFIDAQLKGIIGIKLIIERLEGKTKMSQNRSLEDRQGVIKGLNASSEQRDHKVAQCVAMTIKPDMLR
ncbi:FMN-binding negative transcriptional regulator [Bartonella sp. LJL80]